MVHAFVPALDDAALDLLKHSGDPAADAVIAAVLPGGREAVTALNRALARITFNGDPLPEELPAPVRDFLRAGDAVGTAAGGWDEARMRRGARFFESYGAPIPLLLQLATMPTLYAASHAVKVLAFTARLEHHAHRRSVETAQMVFDAMHPEGFAPGGAGRRSVQKVRLIHATVRHFVRTSGQWDPAWGVPSNLEDTLGVLGGFSCVVVDGLRKFGCEFTDEEADDYYYRWRAVGELIGLPAHALPSTLPALRETFARMKRRQVAPSPEGRRLIHAWIDALEATVPGRRFDHIVAPMIRHLVEDDVAAALGLPDTDPDLARIIDERSRILSVFDRIAGRGNVVRTALDRIASTIVGIQLAVDRRGKRIGYALPVAMAGRWELRTPDEGAAAVVAPITASAQAMHAFSGSLDDADRDLLHGSVARLVAHVLVADGRLDRTERGAADDLFETDIVRALGDDLRWSMPARRVWNALGDWRPGAPAPGEPDDIERIGVLVSRMPPELAATYREVVANACVAVARASGPSMFSRAQVCAEERAALRRIGAALGLTPAALGLDDAPAEA